MYRETEMSNGDLLWMEKHIDSDTMRKLDNIPIRALFEFADSAKDGVPTAIGQCDEGWFVICTQGQGPGLVWAEWWNQTDYAPAEQRERDKILAAVERELQDWDDDKVGYWGFHQLAYSVKETVKRGRYKEKS
jgi:hypothetical protein